MQRIILTAVAVVAVAGSAWAWDRQELEPYCTKAAGAQAMCAPGDFVTGGGGKCPGDPAVLNKSIPFTDANGVNGWKNSCLDMTSHQHRLVDTTYVCCLHPICVFGDEKTCDNPQ